MVTKLFKVKYVEIEPLRGVLQQLVSQAGDTIPFQPDTIIVNDVGSNMHRLERIVDQLDTRAASDEMRVIQVQYATAQEIADKVRSSSRRKTPRPGQRAGGHRARRRPRRSPPGRSPPAGGARRAGSGGPATLIAAHPRRAHQQADHRRQPRGASSASTR